MIMRQRIFTLFFALAAVGLPLQAQTLVLKDTNYEEFLETYQGSEFGVPIAFYRFKDTEYLKTVKKVIFDASLPQIHFRDLSSNGTMRSLEELELDNYKNYEFILLGTKIRKVTIKNSSDTSPMSLYLENNCLSQDSIFSDRKFYKLQMKRAKVTSMERLYSMLDFTTYATHPTLSSSSNADLQLNGGKYDRKSRASADDGIINPTNSIREIDMSRISTELRNFYFRNNLLTKITNVNHPKIIRTELRNNLLWSLDFSSLTETPAGNYNLSPQKPYADLTVEKGAAVDGSQDEVRLYLPDGQSELFDGSRLVPGSVKLLGTAVADQQIFGTTEKYFKLASVAGGVNADLDLYAKHNGFSYQYNTRPNFTGTSNESLRDMRVEVKTYPYIMYINPKTKSGRGVDYYSGTLWLDYDAIVPKGTTVYIATGIKPAVATAHTEAHNQLVLEKIGDPDDLIPAGTAMYVRSNTQAGLYAFQKAWTHEPIGWDGPGTESVAADTLWYNKVYTDEQLAALDAQRARIGNRNILEGSGEPTTFDNPREALILGIESQKGTKMIGFWPYNGTVVPAHRCYITEATYRRLTETSSTATSSGAKGATFYFVENVETTGINSVGSIEKAVSHWYSVDGKKLRGKPTAKGIYIHDGKKEVIL